MNRKVLLLIRVKIVFLNMTSLILKFFAGILAAVVAHRIISTILALVVGILIYLAISNPKLLVEIFENVKDNVGLSHISTPSIKTTKFLVM